MRATWPGAKSGRSLMTTSRGSPSPVSRVKVRVSAIGGSCLRWAANTGPARAVKASAQRPPLQRVIDGTSDLAMDQDELIRPPADRPDRPVGQTAVGVG